MVRFIVLITADSLQGLQDLQKVFDIDIVRSTARQIESQFVVEALVLEEEIEMLKEMGFGVEILGDAEAVVLAGDDHRVPVPVHGEPDGGHGRPPVLHGIVDQVAQHGAQLPLVAGDHVTGESETRNVPSFF
jgi:hypothetical protein